MVTRQPVRTCATLASLVAAAFALVAPVLSQSVPASSAVAAKPTLAAARRTRPIHLDGVLDEPDWARAGVATHFTQRFPDPGKVATFQTEVRILYDDDAIYVGARMFDPHPDSIVAPMARRDPQDITPTGSTSSSTAITIGAPDSASA
jgi:hypothetical protein